MLKSKENILYLKKKFRENFCQMDKYNKLLNYSKSRNKNQKKLSKPKSNNLNLINKNFQKKSKSKCKDLKNNILNDKNMQIKKEKLSKFKRKIKNKKNLSENLTKININLEKKKKKRRHNNWSVFSKKNKNYFSYDNNKDKNTDVYKNHIFNKLNFIKNKMDLIKEKITEHNNCLNSNYGDVIEKVDEKFGYIINSFLKLKIEIKENLKNMKNIISSDINNYKINFQDNLEKLNNINNIFVKNKNFEFSILIDKFKEIEKFTKNNLLCRKQISFNFSNNIFKESIDSILKSINLKINQTEYNNFKDISEYSNEKTVNYFKYDNKNKIINHKVKNNFFNANTNSPVFIPSPNERQIREMNNTKSLNLNYEFKSPNDLNSKNKSIILNPNDQYLNNSIKTILNTNINEDFSCDLSNSKFINLLEKVNINQNQSKEYYNSIINSNNSWIYADNNFPNKFKTLPVPSDTPYGYKNNDKNLKNVFDLHKPKNQNDIILECSREWTVNQTPELFNKDNTNKKIKDNENEIKDINPKNFKKILF